MRASDCTSEHCADLHRAIDTSKLAEFLRHGCKALLGVGQLLVLAVQAVGRRHGEINDWGVVELGRSGCNGATYRYGASCGNVCARCKLPGTSERTSKVKFELLPLAVLIVLPCEAGLTRRRARSAARFRIAGCLLAGGHVRSREDEEEGEEEVTTNFD